MRPWRCAAGGVPSPRKIGSLSERGIPLSNGLSTAGRRRSARTGSCGVRNLREIQQGQLSGIRRRCAASGRPENWGVLDMRRGWLLSGAAAVAMAALAQSALANEELLVMQENPANWVMPLNNYSSTRYSELGADQQGQRRRSAGRVDLLDRRAARARGRSVGDRRHHVHPHAVPQHRLCARSQRHRPGDLEVRAQAGPGHHPGDVLRHGESRRRPTPTARSSCIRPTPRWWRSTRRPARWCGPRSTAIRRRARPGPARRW